MARSTFELTNVVDGCSEGNPGVAGGGRIVRDHDGPMLMAFASFSGINSNNMAEAKAILQGSSMCIDRGYLNTIVESDSMLLVDIINRKLRIPCEGKMALQTRWANLIVTEKEHIVFTEDLSLPKQVRALLMEYQISDSRSGRICILMTNTPNLVCGTQLNFVFTLLICLCSLYSFVYMEKKDPVTVQTVFLKQMKPLYSVLFHIILIFYVYNGFGDA